MKVRKLNYHNLFSDTVKARYGENLTYLNDTCIGGSREPWAVFKVEKPKQDQKEYFIIGTSLDERGNLAGFTHYVTGERLEKDRYQDALMCKKCQTIIYSCMNEDLHRCSCGDCFVTGGKDNFKWGATDPNTCTVVRLDLLTDQVITAPPKFIRKKND